MRCVGRTDDLLIVLGVNVFPSAVKDVVAGFRPRTTGEIRIVLEEAGPRVKPPLKVVAEAVTERDGLKAEIEQKLKAVLSVPALVELVAAGSLPRFEMKGQLIRKNFG